MIADSSAVLAILFAEEDASNYTDAIEAAATCRMSAVNWLETAIRIDFSGNPVAVNSFEDFIREARITIEAVDLEQVQIVRRAYRAYGKGSGHPAGLNFGDCFAYALAKATREPLLYKGDDFDKTDLVPALSR